MCRTPTQRGKLTLYLQLFRENIFYPLITFNTICEEIEKHNYEPILTSSSLQINKLSLGKDPPTPDLFQFQRTPNSEG